MKWTKDRVGHEVGAILNKLTIGPFLVWNVLYPRDREERDRGDIHVIIKLPLRVYAEKLGMPPQQSITGTMLMNIPDLNRMDEMEEGDAMRYIESNIYKALSCISMVRVEKE